MKTRDGSDIKIVYVLLDGVSDLPHPNLNGLTPLDAAYTAKERRACRNIQQTEANEICRTLTEEMKFSDSGVSFVIQPTVAHRVSVRFRHATLRFSDKITNTDPAYQKVHGIGIAKVNLGNMHLEKSYAEEDTEAAAAAKTVNEFSEQVIKLLKGHPFNKRRVSSGKAPMNAILLRDSGNTASIVDMPVEIGISKVLDMKTLEAGAINDYETKAVVTVDNLEYNDGIYVHIKGPDEFGHDGDAQGKKRSIEDIDRVFFGTLRKRLTTEGQIMVISSDHSTPCIKKAHSADPVPVLFSGNMVKKDASARFTEKYASTGSIGRVMGSTVLRTAIDMIRNNGSTIAC